MGAFSRRLGVPANQLLVESINRQMCDYVMTHPEQGPQLLADLDGLDAEAAAQPDEPRIYPLETIVANLRTATRKFASGVH